MKRKLLAQNQAMLQHDGSARKNEIATLKSLHIIRRCARLEAEL